MAVIKDIVIVLHSVVIMVAVQYLLADHKLVECETKQCSLNDKESSTWNTMLSMKREENEEMECSCCKFERRSIASTIFTAQALIHITISIVSILLKRMVFSLRKLLWLYLVLIVIAIVNAFYITRVLSFSNTIQDNNSVNIANEGVIWTIIASPLRLTWRIVSSLIYTGITKLLIHPMGLSGKHGNVNTLYICSLNTDDVTSFNSEYGLSVLSWVYMLSAVFSVYTLVKCMSRERLQRTEIQACGNSCNNNCKNGVKCVKRSERLDFVDAYSSDEDSFVLGWRL